VECSHRGDTSGCDTQSGPSVAISGFSPRCKTVISKRYVGLLGRLSADKRPADQGCCLVHDALSGSQVPPGLATHDQGAQGEPHPKRHCLNVSANMRLPTADDRAADYCSHILTAASCWQQAGPYAVTAPLLCGQQRLSGCYLSVTISSCSDQSS
jgi:hypothetical protein